MLLGKTVDAIGKTAIVTIPVSEAAHKLGFVMDVDTYQFIAAIGVIALIIDRSIRLYWCYKDRKIK